MKFLRLSLLAVAMIAAAAHATAQTPAPSPAPAGAPTDVYSVTFLKAAPGQAAALAKELQVPDPKNPMAAHFLLLRHQEGADWDFCLIQHAGAKATVEIAPQAATPAGATPTMAWHEDTYVSGPSWPEFQKAMGLSGAAAGRPIFIVGVHRAVPGHRSDLERALAQRAPGGKSTDLMMTHLDGAPWQYLTLSRYGSWQDLAAEQAAPASGDGWSELRKYSAFHNDTIADRVQ